MKKLKTFFKRWGIDILGVFLIVTGIAIAPIPGPGGFYFFLPGLAILVANNIWIKGK